MKTHEHFAWFTTEPLNYVLYVLSSHADIETLLLLSILSARKSQFINAVFCT